MSIGDRPLFSWLHLSDLHFGHGDTAYKWNQKNLLDLLARDIETANKSWPELPRVDAVFVTGDVAFSAGTLGRSEYTDAYSYIERVATSLSVPVERVFVVPGNHDVQRGASHDVETARGDAATLDTILADDNRRAALLARFDNYKAFSDRFSQRKVDGWRETLPVSELGEIAIIGLNTALLSNDDVDRGKLHLSEQQLALLSQERTPFSIVLTHHPVDDGWLRGDRSLQALLCQRARVHLCGHVHDPAVDLLATAGGLHHVRLVAAAAHRDPNEPASEKVSHGYNFASLIVDPHGNLLVRSWPRRWFPKWASFRVDHFGVPDRGHYDDKVLQQKLGEGSGLAAEDPDSSGLLGTHWWGSPTVLWDQLLAGRRRLDVFGIAVRTLFEPPNVEHMKAFLEHGGEVNVVLADPRNKTSMARYDEDFDQPLGDRTDKVKKMLRALVALRQRLGGQAAKLVVKLTPYTFKYSAYRLDDEYLFVPYRMMPGKRTVDTPALLLDGRGSFARRYLAQDLDDLLQGGVPLTEEVLAIILEPK